MLVRALAEKSKWRVIRHKLAFGKKEEVDAQEAGRNASRGADPPQIQVMNADKLDYRSISPSTMSRLPITATASAISMPPWFIAFRALIAVKHGERALQRNGFSVPSLTR